MKNLRLLFLVVFVALILPSASLADDPSPPMESPNYTIAWSTVGETHGGQAASDNFSMETAVVGQMFAQSASTSTHYDMGSGFVFPPSLGYRVYLPLVIRK